MTPNDPNWPATIKPTNITGAFVIERPFYPDSRGSFQEVFRLSELEAAVGEKIIISQINNSTSIPRVLRGIHVATWAKLVHCYSGNVFQVIVDCRKDSPTFKEVFTCEMGENHPCAVWVPPNCGNAYCVLGDTKSVYGYANTAEYGNGKESGFLWNGEEFADKIKWPISDPILSDKDKVNKTFTELFSS